MDLSIIIVNYNTRGMTADCIESVRSHTVGTDYEILLVDNASTDGSREFFEAMSGIRYIYLEENLGFGKANNKALECACGRNVIFLNSDTLLTDDSLSVLSRYLDGHPEAGACGGNLTRSDGSPNQSFERAFPGTWKEFDAFLNYIPSRIRHGRSRFYNHTGKPLEVAMISGADLMVRKSVLDAVGGFDPRFFMYSEDVELCRRVHLAGCKVMSVPAASIIHLGGKSTGAGVDPSYRIKAMRSQLAALKQYFDVTGEPGMFCKTLKWRRAQARTRILMHAFNKPLRDKWRAYLELYKSEI